MKLHYEDNVELIDKFAGTKVFIKQYCTGGYSEDINLSGTLIGMCERDSDLCNHGRSHIRIKFNSANSPYHGREFCCYWVDIELDPDGNY